MTEKTEKQLPVFRGEISLLAVILINSLGVVLMLFAGSGISAISSVPYALSLVFPHLTLGTWTYIFQGALIFSLMIMRKKFVPNYLFSFVVGFAFSMMLDVYELKLAWLPMTIPCRVLYFAAGYLLIAFGVALSNRCGLPIIPTDLFPREVSSIKNWKYSRVKITCDLTCLAVTGLLTGIFLGHIDGLGIGTVIAAFTMGKVIGSIGECMDHHVKFVSFMTKKNAI